MSVIIRLQGLPWSASALDIRHFFKGLTIPAGGVHIIGGERGDAFIAFGSDEDARQAMMRSMSPISGTPVQLFLSSKSEMQSVIEEARAAESGGVVAMGMGVGGAAPGGLTTQPASGMQQGQGQPMPGQGQSFPGPHGAASQRFPPGGDNQSQFSGAQTFTGAGQMSAQPGRDGQFGFHGDKTQGMSPNFPGTGMNQGSATASGQYGFPPVRNQQDSRFQSSQQDAAGYGLPAEGGYSGNENQQWQGQGQNFPINQQYYGADQFQGRPGGQQNLQQRPGPFPPGASGRDGQFQQRQQQPPFPPQGGDQTNRHDPFTFSQQQGNSRQEGPDGPGRFPIKLGRPDQPELGKGGPVRPGMTSFGDEQIPGRRLDPAGPRPLPGAHGMMRPDHQESLLADPQGQMRSDHLGPMRTDPQGPMRVDHPAPLRPDQRGPMRPDLSGPIRPDQANMRPDQAGPMRPDQPGSARLDPQAPLRPDRTEPVPGVGRLDQPRPIRPDQPRPLRPDQPGLSEPRTALLRPPAPGRVGAPQEDPKPLPGAIVPEAGRPRGRGMLPTPDIPPLMQKPQPLLAGKAFDDPYGGETAMEQDRWPGEEGHLRGPREDFREGGPDPRHMRRDPDLRRPDPEMGRGRGQFADDSDFRNASRPGGRPMEGPDRRRFDGPGDRAYDLDGRFEGPGGRRFDGPRGYDDPERFSDLPDRRFDDHREYEDVPMREFDRRDRDFDPRDRDFDPRDRDFDPRDRDFDRFGRDFDGHPGGRGFPPPRGRAFPGRRPEGPRGRGFDRGGRGRGFEEADHPPFDRREFDRPMHPGGPEFPPYPMDEEFERGGFDDMHRDDRMLEREFGEEPRGLGYPPFAGEMDFDDRREGGRGRLDMGRGRMDVGRGRLDGGRGRFDGPPGQGRGFDTDRRWNGPNREDIDARGRDPERGGAGGVHAKPGLLGDAPPGLLPPPDVKPEEDRDSRSRDSQRDRDRRGYSDRRDRDDRNRGRDERSSRRSDRRSHERGRRDSRSSDRSSHRSDRDRDHRRDRDRDRDRERDRDRDRSSNRDRRSKDRSSKDRTSAKKDSEKSETDKKTDDSKKSPGVPSKYIYAQNFPTSFNYKDIRRFFIGCELPFDGIKIINNISGQRTGEVYLKFATEDIAKRAMKHNDERVQGNTVSLTYVTIKDFENQVDSQKPPESGGDEDKAGAGQDPPLVMRQPEKSNLIVQVRGLPLNVKREDLVRFFSTVQIADNGDAVFIEYDSRNQGTGIAYMEVASVQDFRTAMGYDGRLFGPRTIKLSVGRREDMDILIKKQQEMFQRQAHRAQDQQSMGGSGLGPSLMGPRPPLLPQGTAEPRSLPQPLMSLGILGPPPRNGPALMQSPPIRPESNGDKPQGGQLQPSAQSQELCVHIQGLPMLATQREIRDFFSDLNIVQRGIQIVHDGVGKPMGEGFVEFSTVEEREKALKRDKTAMGRHIVAVKPIAKQDMIERLRNARLVGLPPGQGPPGGPGPHMLQPGGPDIRPKAIPPGVLNRQWVYLRCQNFPNNIGIAEIMAFFKGYRAVGESIRLHFMADGSPTGNAVVGFPTADDANRALQELNGKLCRQSPVLLQPAM